MSAYVSRMHTRNVNIMMQLDKQSAHLSYIMKCNTKREEAVLEDVVEGLSRYR